jgi:cytochrome c oxidase assembly protein subunit 15
VHTSNHSPWLHRFAVLTAASTFPLIFIGGLVTSKGAGLAVPDWPNTYGYNMFLFPPSKWVGNIFYEHGHRLFASGVGLLTVVLAIWLWKQEPRRWVRCLGAIALAAVVCQGVLGGLRVILLKSELGIFHACLAQAFFCLGIAIAFATSRWWKETRPQSARGSGLFRAVCVVTTAVVFCQLALGAVMRHTQSGLAIPDFPLAYGHWMPPPLEEANAWRAAIQLEPVTAGQILIHFSHRAGAVAVTVSLFVLAALIFRRYRSQRKLVWLAAGLVALLVLQIFLGAWTVLSGKAADVATGHVAVGALILAGSFSITLMAYKLFAPVASAQPSADSTGSTARTLAAQPL